MFSLLDLPSHPFPPVLEVLRRAIVVECEALFVPLYHDQPLFGDLQVFMRNEGFLFLCGQTPFSSTIR